jgi:outer membrane protein
VEKRPSRQSRVASSVSRVTLAALLWTLGTAAPTQAETLREALSAAYKFNPRLDAARATLRATDEEVPRALSGYRPSITGSADTSARHITTSPTSLASGDSNPRGYQVGLVQPLFRGFRTTSAVSAAEATVRAGRETLRLAEQSVLLEAVTAFGDVVRDAAIVRLRENNVTVLTRDLRATQDRFNVGEVTRTDVAQAESSLAAGRSQVLLAQANYTASQATYRQVIGVAPGKLAPATPVDRFSPHNLPGAVASGTATNPAVTTAEYNVDVALQAVKVAEGALYPTVSVTGSFTQNWLSTQGLSVMNSYNASVLGTVSVPIYQGGAEYSLIRQAKETLGQKRLDLDTARDSVRQAVVQAWGQLDAAKANIEATQAQVQASEIALNGVREEARVGQRTTFDVLTAQQTLVNARVALVTAQHDRVVASYTLLSAVGRLSPEVLGLRIPTYDAAVHYQQVRDSWAGVRTPDGR